MDPFPAIDEVEERRAIIEQMRDDAITFTPYVPPMNYMQFSYLMGMPLPNLRALSQQTPTSATLSFVFLGRLTSHFFEGQAYNTSPLTPATNASAPWSARLGTCPVSPNSSTIEYCRRLDWNRCIVTGLPESQICPILPLTWNETEDNLQKTRTLLGCVQGVILERNREAYVADAELVRGVHCTEKAWNALNLSPQLQTWWGKAFFGFKYHGATVCEDDPDYSIILLQFVWMPCSTKARAFEEVDPEAERDPSTGFRSYLDHRYGGDSSTVCRATDCAACEKTMGVRCYDIATGQRIKSGTIIKVKRLTEHRPLFEHTIKTQWSIICAASLSGGPLTDDDPLSSESEDSSGGSISEEEDMRLSDEGLSEPEEYERQESFYKVNKWLNHKDGMASRVSPSSKLGLGYSRSL
ncbi:hypothetical protein FGADI_5264 [Fusarium gaditjirri]|uniref:HNH nuclease domain-containing protein n=1 Tax=Fusarium gaditjirri TaxID=282569 RepID=A0A8H4WYD0_9HYPO|nr:hypothetical protein FGADI_5264 [Fusarium gaditjirri]